MFARTLRALSHIAQGHEHVSRVMLPPISCHHCCRVQSVEQAKQAESRPGQLWQWRAPWQTSSRGLQLRPRAAEGCIRRWQVSCKTRSCSFMTIHSALSISLGCYEAAAMLVSRLAYKYQLQRSSCLLCLHIITALFLSMWSSNLTSLRSLSFLHTHLGCQTVATKQFALCYLPSCFGTGPDAVSFLTHMFLQVAKALALGPRHDGSLLQDVIAEPYLSKVRKDVASARKAGWFWSYRLSDLYVR